MTPLVAVTVAVAVGGASSPAEAGHHCVAVADVVGYARCSRFGDWARPQSATFEVGTSVLRFRMPPPPATAEALRDGVPTTYALHAGDAMATGTGFELRAGLAFSRTWYVVNQWEFAPVSDGAPVRVDATARGTTTTTDSARTAFVMQASILVGAHRRFGAWSLAAEAGPGVRALYPLLAGGLPDSTAIPQQQGYVAVQPKLDYWLSPTFSVGVGASLASDAGAGIGVVVGAHLAPYDMSR